MPASPSSEHPCCGYHQIPRDLLAEQCMGLGQRGCLLQPPWAGLQAGRGQQ